MTAPVRIDAEAWSDLRFATLARILGLADSDHALIKVARIWSWQTEHYKPEAPTYVVDQDTIESALGNGGAAAMVRARLAEETPEGFRIRGSKDRIEWLWKCRRSAKLGGETTRDKWKASPGRTAPERTPDNKRQPSGLGDGTPVGSATARPELGPLILSPDLDPDQSAHAGAALSLGKASLSSEQRAEAIVRAEREEVPLPEAPPGERFPMPRNWEPEHEPDLEEDCRALGIDVAEQLARLRNRNEEREDWQERWREWLRRALDFEKKQRRPAQPSPAHAAAQSAAIAARNRAEAARERSEREEKARLAAAEREQVARDLAALLAPKATA